MFKRNYTVKGEDVNDFMVMQNAAFLTYASKLFDVFLFVNGFTKLKMNSLKLGVKKGNDSVLHYNHLMFTQPFSIVLDFKELGSCKKKMIIEIHFYNKQNELVATIIRELFWFNYKSWETIIPPKTISKYFFNSKEYKQVG
tara:strand:+ start:13850 stop:14272 length:423 start_codon:yes stop_codon:yes gene_type:complete